MTQNKIITKKQINIEKISQKILVLKIGGSCLVNGKSLKVISQRIKNLKNQGFLPIIVVSAFKEMTDSLLDMAINGLAKEDPKIKDSLLSEGEQLSAKILQLTLKSLNLNAEAILINDPRFPIITDENFGKANVLLENTLRKIRNSIIPILEKEIIPIIPGFIGITQTGIITTLGKGSSDVTAVLIGKALKTKSVFLLKDVPGILSGDPKIIEKPETLPKITVEECLDLGLRGGKVLCPISLIYKPKDINIRIIDVASENIFEGGTEVLGELKSRIKITLDIKKKVAVTVIGKKMSEIPGLLSSFSDVLKKVKINVYSVSASDFSVCFYVNMKQEKDAMKALHDVIIKDDRLTAITSLSNIAMVTIAGKIFESKSKVLGKIGNALADNKIELVDISTSACEADMFVNWDDRLRTKKILEELF